jgi:hypothetical protein
MGVVALTLNQSVWWYTARASGLVAWLLVASSVGWGLVVAGRLTRKLPPPAWNLDLHRFLGGLAVVFTAVHVSSLAADRYVHFGWSELLVPLASRWRPWAVGWGVTALYLLVAVELTSLLMRRLPRRLWRSVHASAFVLFVVATLHGIQAGTDAHNRMVRWGGLTAAALALLLGVARLAVPARRSGARPQSGRAAGKSPALTSMPGVARPSTPSSQRTASSRAGRDRPVRTPMRSSK